MTNPSPSPLPADLTDRMVSVSREIHATPETAFHEHAAVGLLTGWLADEGFRIESGAGGLDTAFVARHPGISGEEGAAPAGPTIAVLAEYDALPGVGHGCGHNLIAAGAVAAAVDAARRRPEHVGTIAVIGTPAEEAGGGKVLLADAGVFDGIDAAMMFHPSDVTLTMKHALAAAHLEIVFHGRASHAAKSPWDGRSALAAAQVLLVALDAMRQFVRPTARIHAVIRDGGDAPNVVPALTRVELMVRDSTLASVRELTARVELAARGAALATETTHEVRENAPTYAERINNRTRAERFGRTLTEGGLEAREGRPDDPSGSSDIGNVMRVVPAIHPCVQITEVPTPGHSELFRAAAITPLAHERTAIAARAMSDLLLDLLDRPELLAAARDEFATMTSDAANSP
jgi:amidohydrolase